ncbi:hypothetical protein [Roseovarius mucosus]|uniref:hypothetical protein n=1 Tax=Roseovarius mucosus TaxID=215743 RepID=UPI0035CF0832
MKLTVYLDTSSWNYLLSGQMPSLRRAFGRSGSCIPCYSIQSIEELLGVRDERKKAELDLQLDAVGARYFETLSDTEGGVPTGHRITVINREERCQIYEDMQKFSLVGGFGLGDLIQKFIGGIGSTSFEDVSKMALADIEGLLDFDVSELPPELAAMVTSEAEAMKEQARKAQHDLLEQLNRQDDIRLQQLDPARINNFTGTGAFERIIEVARDQAGTSKMVEVFLGGPPRVSSKRADAHLGTPTWEQVYRLAQLLFLLGYWRELKHLKDRERARIDFAGGQADIFHIANASFCSIFHTTDKPQAHLAAAVYDHLNVPTLVLLYTPKTGAETTLYAPKSIQALGA